MKLQYIAIIFVLIIVPISMVMSVYIQNQIDAINLQTQYDSNLITATYDAIKAFQLNTVNNKYSGISDSKIRDIEASVNTFYNSLISSMSQYVQSPDELRDYTPALLYTLYDGYYIYTAYDNVYSTTGMGEDEQVNIDLDSNDYQYGLKPYVYYSAKYQLNNGDVAIVNYTLDNYITVYGNIESDGSYVARSGYLINPDLVSEIDENNKTLVYDGVEIGPETLQEHLITIEESGATTEGDYYYLVYDNNKIYQDGDQYFYYNNSFQKAYINAPEILSYLEDNRNTLGGGEHICSTSAFDYYNDAYEFSNWLMTTKLSDVTQEDLLKYEDSTQTIGTDNTYLSNNVQGNMFVPGEDNDPMLSASAFNNHRLAVIRKSIETNLAIVIDNYMVTTTLYDYVMPKLTDDDWYKITNNVSVTSFMQGMAIGYKYYNNYAIITNNINEEVVKPENIYIVVEKDGNREYHQPGCEELLEEVQDGSLTIVGAYPTSGFQRQTVDINENSSEYYYPQNIGGGSDVFLTGCYNCIVNSTAEYDLQDIIAGDDLISYFDRTENGGTGNVSFATEQYSEIRKWYLSGLARERYDIYKSNINLQQ